MNQTVNVNDLSIVREYFSHNIRTSTAMVVATVMVMKCGLGADYLDSSEIISESAYFLDIYDKGMDICFDSIFGKQFNRCNEDIHPSRIMAHFKGKLPITIQEQEMSISLDLDDYCFKSNSYITKSLLELVLCDIVSKGTGSVSVKGRGGVYSIDRESSTPEVPDIFNIYRAIFKQLGVAFSYDKNRIELRFS